MQKYISTTFIAVLLIGIIDFARAENYTCEQLREPSHEEKVAIFGFRKTILHSIDQCFELQPKGKDFEDCYQKSFEALIDNPNVIKQNPSPLMQQKLIETIIEGRFHVLNRQLFGRNSTVYDSWLNSRTLMLKGLSFYPLIEARLTEVEQAINEKFRKKRQYLTRILSLKTTHKPDLSGEYQALLAEEGLALLQLEWVKEIVRQEAAINLENRNHRLEVLKGGTEGLAGTLGFLYIVYYGRFIFEPIKLAYGPVLAGCSLGAIGGTAIHLIEKTTHNLATAYKDSTEHKTPLSCEWSKAMSDSGEQWKQLVTSAAFGSASGCVIVGAAILAPRTTTVAIAGSLAESIGENSYKAVANAMNANEEFTLAKDLDKSIAEAEQKNQQQSQSSTSLQLGLVELKQARDVLQIKNTEPIKVDNSNQAFHHIMMAHRYFADAGEYTIQTMLSSLLMRNYIKSWLEIEPETPTPQNPSPEAESIAEEEAVHEAVSKNPKSGKAAKAVNHLADSISKLAHKFSGKVGSMSTPGAPTNPEVTDTDSAYLVFKNFWKSLFSQQDSPPKN